MDMASPDDKNTPVARFIAFYLPQFHPIPENDKWWGKGFTEWTNVAKAKPLYTDHEQPKLPSELGFYDLRVPEVRQAQAELAREHGIEGFCYWHYWFGHGQRLLERPFSEVLASGKPDYPFCLGWANSTWSGIWHGAPDRILIEQNYPGPRDHKDHFYNILNALQDERYLRISGKPIFLVYRPMELPDPIQFTDAWREMAHTEGLGDLCFIGVADLSWQPGDFGFDSVVSDPPGDITSQLDSLDSPVQIRRIFRRNKKNTAGPKIYDYQEIVELAASYKPDHDNFFPCVLPNWDNTPRSGKEGIVFANCTPELFTRYLESALSQVIDRPLEERLIFIKSWNEWAEGNYLEPDMVSERANLEALLEVVRRG